MPQTYREPSREIPVSHDVDVVVAGGGTAGVAAAVCAARLGLATVMVEQTALPGGMVTHVTHWLNDFDNKGGFAREFLEGISEHGVCKWPYHNPFLTAAYLDDVIRDAGVRHLYLARVAAPMIDGDGVLEGIVVESKSGRHAVRAKVVIDATGDGDVAALAGADFHMGRESDGACQAVSLSHMLMNYTGPALGNEEFLAEIDRAAQKAGNNYRIPYDRARVQMLPGTERLWYNGTPHVTGLNPLDAEQLSDLMVALRDQGRAFYSTMKPNSEAFKDIEFGPFSAIPGVRESRRIVCDEMLAYDDVATGRKRENGLFLVSQSIDIHCCTPEEPSIYVEKVKPYHIPLGALLPAGLENLMVAGRCIGGDHRALASYRIIADCFAMGEAAAITSRLAVDRGLSPRQIPAADVAAEMAVRGYRQ
jgi:hypothetical protein